MTRPPGSEQASNDPFELWRQIYDANERAWSAALEQVMQQPSFAAQTGKILETFLASQKVVRDNMRAYLETINVPTREDIARLGELIIGLEEKVDQLDDRLGGLESALRSAAQPAPPSGEAPAGKPSSGERPARRSPRARGGGPTARRRGAGRP